MRTLFEIVEGAKDGNKPTHDECYYAMLALSALLHFDHMDVLELYEKAKESKPSPLQVYASLKGEGSFNRQKRAFVKSPQEWLGNETPDNPEYQKRRNMAFKVAEKATGIDFRATKGA